MDEKNQFENQEEQEEKNENKETGQESEERAEAVSESAEDNDNQYAELDRLKQEKDELYDRLLRLQAEYDNFRKRTQREKEADRKYKSQSVVTELLPALDSFERALNVEVKDETAKGIIEGLQIVYRQVKDVLNKEGVEEIPAVGEAFDPQFHQAVMQVEEDGYEPNTVIEELQKGYKLKDRVIRPAMVKVNQ